MERPKCIKKEWGAKRRGRERILCEPVRDVGAMHDFDNSFLSPCPRDIRAKDRTGSTEAFRGSLYIREKSMILIVIVATPVYLRVEEGCNRETTAHWYFHRSSLIATCHEYRGGNDWKTFRILQQRNLWIFPSWNWRRFENPCRNSPPPRFKQILRASKIRYPRIFLLPSFPRIRRRSWKNGIRFFQIRRVWKFGSVYNRNDSWKDSSILVGDNETCRSDDRSRVHQETIRIPLPGREVAGSLEGRWICVAVSGGWTRKRGVNYAHYTQHLKSSTRKLIPHCVVQFIMIYIQ